MDRLLRMQYCSVRAVVDEFEVEEKVAAGDLEKLLDQLNEFGVIEED